MDLNQLLASIDQMLTGAGGAVTATNAQDFNQRVSEFNNNYGLQQAGAYGYNPGTTGAGIQYPSPYAPTLGAQQDIGAIGYIPGYSGVGAAQSLAGLSQNDQLAQQNANNTGFYNTPMNSAYTPGTFLNIDPSTYPSQYGTQMDYVLPSGQLQRVTPDQARAMGFKGQTSGTIGIQQALGLESAPPSSVPQETLGAQGQYSNLNTQAQGRAVQQAGMTGYYAQPGQIVAPGTNMLGQTFSSLPQSIQQNYYNSRGGDWNAAMQGWVQDSNSAIMQANPNAQDITKAGTPQETLQAQGQMFGEANQLGTEYGQYYSPMMPGQTAQPGVNTPRVGQITEAGREFNVNTAGDLAKLASTLTGPADYFKYLQALNGGNNILQNLYTGAGQPPGGAVGSTGGAQSLDNILSQFGLSSQQLTGGVLPNGTYGQMVGVNGQQPPGSIPNGANVPLGMPAGGGAPSISGTPTSGGSSNGGSFGGFGGGGVPNGTPNGTPGWGASQGSTGTSTASGVAAPTSQWSPDSGMAAGGVLSAGGATAGGGYNMGGMTAPPNGGGSFGGFSPGSGGGGVTGGTGGVAGSSSGVTGGSRFTLPPPNQIQPSAYNSLSPSAQQFVQGAYQAAGYNPQDLNWFMNAATPAATSTSTGVAGGGTAGMSTHFANPGSQSLFA